MQIVEEYLDNVRLSVMDTISDPFITFDKNGVSKLINL